MVAVSFDVIFLQLCNAVIVMMICLLKLYLYSQFALYISAITYFHGVGNDQLTLVGDPDHRITKTKSETLPDASVFSSNVCVCCQLEQLTLVR
jgi:hypothetical protein